MTTESTMKKHAFRILVANTGRAQGVDVGGIELRKAVDYINILSTKENGTTIWHEKYVETAIQYIKSIIK